MAQIKAWLAFAGLTFFLVAAAQAIPDMNNSTGYYYDNFDSTQGVGASSQVQINTAWNSVTLTAGSTSGWFQSTTITPTSLQGWLQLETQLSRPTGTTLTFDVLDANLNVLQTFSAAGAEALHTETFDLSGVDSSTYPDLILRVSFSAPSGSPVLYSWKLKWVLKPNLFLKLEAASSTDPQGVTVVAGTQIGYTVVYNVNNVSASNVVVSTLLSSQDGYGVEMINYSTGSALPTPVIAGRLLTWNLGNLAAGTNGNLTFSVSVPDGTINSVNSPTHTHGLPIQLTAKLVSTQTGAAGIISSPTGNSLVGSAYGAPTLTYVSSTPHATIVMFRPAYAVPDSDYTYTLYINNKGNCNTHQASEKLVNLSITGNIPTGFTFIKGGLFRNAGFATSPTLPAYSSGTVTWQVNQFLPSSGCSCSYAEGLYLYVTVHIPNTLVPGNTFTIPPMTLTQDQSAPVTTAALAAVSIVDPAAVAADPRPYVGFSGSCSGPATPCAIVTHNYSVYNNCNLPLRGTYLVEPIDPQTQFYQSYLWCYAGGSNGDVDPKGNSQPSFWWARQAGPLPDPPNLASGIWTALTKTPVPRDATHIMINTGNLNYTLPNGMDNVFYYYYLTRGNAAPGTTISHAGKLYLSQNSTTAQAMTAGPYTLPVTGLVQSLSLPSPLQISVNPIQAGATTRLSFGSWTSSIRNGYVYDMMPPAFYFEPAQTTTSQLIYDNACGATHALWLEYTTTPGVYPFDRNTAEHASWSRVQPLDITTITGVRWVVGDFWYVGNGGGGTPLSLGVSLRAKMGLPDNTQAVNTLYFTYDGIGTGPVPFLQSVPLTILSHVQLAISKVVDKSLLPASRVQYYLNYANTGNMNETAATLWDKVPANTEFVGAKGPAGSSILYSSNPSASLPSSPADWSATTLGASTTWVKWQVPGVPAGQLLAVTLTTKPLASLALGAVIANTFSIVGANASTLTSNTVTIINAPDFSDVSTTNLGVDPEGDVKAGTLMHYVLTYYNTGLTSAHHVMLEAPLDTVLDESRLQYNSTPAGTYDAATRTIHWDVGDVGTGLGGACMFTVPVTSGAVPARALQVTARVKSDETPWVNTNTVSNNLVTQLQTVQVEVEPKLEGLVGEYRIAFKLGAGGGLAAGDQINVEFPNEIKLPDLIDFGKITINGDGTQQVSTVAAQTLTITVPHALSGDSDVAVVIKAEVGIKNPGRGNYTLRLNTNREGIWVTSQPYLITLWLGDNEVVVAPNPAQGELVKVFYNMLEAGEAEVNFYNVVGERVAQIVERKKLEKGASSTWHVGRVGSGVYLCRITLRYDSGRTVKLPVKKVVVINAKK
ncbi:MAG: hypothetical protein HGA76_00550 [Candidatus Firestonebacteria bacterium]|nr:hypothetical protein [Candidatus Firestonebacteria bacterium]